MTTRRDAISFGVASLLPEKHALAPDRALASLVAEHAHFEGEILAAEDAADAFRHSAGACALAREAACARAEALHMAQGRVANAIINLPAASFAGVAYKLILWRREAAISFPDDFDAAHESFTFSAYRDLLRLTGLEALAHVHDQATLARMRNYWIPS